MQEILDKIEWSATEFGEWGPDIPILIKHLVELEEHETDLKREYTFSLCGRISHSGDIYELTLSSAEVLIELLKSEKVKAKDRILYVLSCLAFRSPFRSDLQEELYDLMGKEIELFLDFLRHSDPGYRRLSSIILLNFNLHVNKVAIALTQAIIYEHEYDIRIDLFGSLIELLLSDHNGIDTETRITIINTLESMLDSDDLIIRSEAAIVLFCLNYEQIQPKAINILSDTIQKMDEFADVHYKFHSHLGLLILSLKQDHLEEYLKQMFPDLSLNDIDRLIEWRNR